MQTYEMSLDIPLTESTTLSRLEFLDETRRHHWVLLQEEKVLESQVETARKTLLKYESLLIDTRDQRIALEAAIIHLDPGTVEDINELVED